MSPTDSASLLLERHRNERRRYEQRLGLIERLLEHVDSSGADDRAARSAEALIEYFDRALPLHRAADELQVFPALMAGVPARERGSMRRLIASCNHDHEHLEVAWRRAREALQAIAAARDVDLALIRTFTTLSLRHLAREERELLERAFP